MKRFNGTVVQQLVNVKSIVIMMLIVATFLGFACSNKSHATSTDIGGKGREVVKANAALVHTKEDIGGGRGQEIRYSVVHKQPVIIVLEVGGKSTRSSLGASLGDVGGGKTDSSIRITAIHKDIGGKSLGTNQKAVVFEAPVFLVFDVGGGKTLSTAKNALADIGGRSTTNTGNLCVVFQNDSDVEGQSTRIVRLYACTLYNEVGGKGIKSMRVGIPKTDFS